MQLEMPRLSRKEGEDFSLSLVFTQGVCAVFVGADSCPEGGCGDCVLGRKNADKLTVEQIESIIKLGENL
jgi:hypothetical protein